MKIFDAHLHLDVRGFNDIEGMVLAGVRWAVSFSHNPYRMSSKEVYFDHYDRLLRVERARASEAGLQLWVALGVHPHAVPDDAFELLDALRGWANQEGVVALGEAGLTDSPTRMEREVLKEEMRIARDLKKPIFVTLPEKHRRKCFNRVVEMAEEVDVSPELVVVSNVDPTLAKSVASEGFWVGVNMWPPRPYTQPENFAQAFLSEAYDPDRLLVFSDLCSYHTDPLALPRVAFAMERAGVPEEVLRKVFLENPKKLYNLPI